MASWAKHLIIATSVLCVVVPACLLTAPSEEEVLGGCSDGFKECAGKCVAVSDPSFGCGDTCEPCHVDNALAICQAGACVVGECQPGFDDCNEQVVDGCESELRTDPQNCSKCKNACASGMCNDGGCCKTLGSQCGSALECCGLECQGKCCVKNGDACESASDCCQGVCTGLRCCRGTGIGCSEDEDCCSDNCTSGSCE